MAPPAAKSRVTTDEAPLPFPARHSEIEQLLDLTQAVTARLAGSSRRETPRFPLSGTMAEGFFLHPGGTRQARMVIVDNVSTNGAGIIYPGFLHERTTVELRIPNLDGMQTYTHGKVAWVRHLTGRFHLVGIQLETKIDPRRMVDSETYLRHLQQPSATDLSDCTGATLCIENSALDRALLKMLLEDTGLAVHLVADGGGAIDEFRRRPFDLIFCELNLGNQSGLDVIRTLRNQGYGGPIIVLTLEQRPDILAEAKAAGACEIVPKPYTKEILLNAVRRAMSEHFDRLGGSRPVFSELPQPSAEPIKNYVDEVKRRAADLDRLVQANDLQRVRDVLSLLRATGTGFGFEVMSTVAGAALEAITASGGLTDARAEISRVNQVARRMAVPHN